MTSLKYPESNHFLGLFFQVEGRQDELLEHQLFTREMNDPSVLNRWIGYSLHHWYEFKVHSDRAVVTVRAKGVSPPLERTPSINNFYIHHKGIQLDTETLEYPYLPGEPRLGYPLVDRLRPIASAYCLGNHQTWNAFRIDATTKVVEIALDYKRTIFCRVNLIDFVKHKMWSKRWHLVRGQACMAIDLTLSEKFSTECAIPKWGGPTHIHNETAYSMGHFFYEDKVDARIPPLEAMPRLEDLVWLSMQVYILDTKYQNGGLYDWVSHRDNDPLNYTRDNLVLDPTKTIPVCRVTHTHCDEQRKQYNLSKGKREKFRYSEMRQAQHWYCRQIAQLHALRTAQGITDSAEGVAESQEATARTGRSFTPSLVVFPYSQDELDDIRVHGRVLSAYQFDG